MNKLNKPVTKKFKRSNVYSRLKDNIWVADLAEMESLSSKDKNIKYLLRVTDVFFKYAWVKPLKDKAGTTVLDAFIEIINKFNSKPNKLWVDQGKEFYNKPKQECLNNNDILMYSTHNQGKSVIAETFIKTLKAKMYKKMTANDAMSYLAYLNKLVDQCNDTYHHSINKKLINANYSALTKNIETNLKAPKFKVNDKVRITKYKNILVMVNLKIG